MNDLLARLLNEVNTDASEAETSRLVLPSEVNNGASFPEADHTGLVGGSYACAIFLQGGRYATAFELTGRKAGKAQKESLTLEGYGQQWSLGWDAGQNDILYFKMTWPAGRVETFTFAPFIYTNLALVFTHGYVRAGGEPSQLRIMGAG